MRDERYPGPLADENRFRDWLATARDDRVLASTVTMLRERYRLDARWMEAKLLAEQGKRRRMAVITEGGTSCRT